MPGSASPGREVITETVERPELARPDGEPGAESVLAGRYELRCSLGGGGMGVVYRGVDRVLERAVAVKLLPHARLADEAAIVRFEREARAAASLCHPNIVSVFDAGSDAGIRFIVMEYVRGISLAELLRRRGYLAVGAARHTAAEIARALAAAHAAGIVHRDVKPGNVMIDEAGTIKLLDFGIAQAHMGASRAQTGSVLGSADYMAPEVVRGEAAQERSDVYSLGCVLYECLTGRTPFAGESVEDVLRQHVSALARSASALRPEIPAALDELVVQMLAKRAVDRPSAAQLAKRLERSDRQQTSAAKLPVAVKSGRGSPGKPTLVLSQPRRRRRRAAAIVAALVAFACVLAAAYAVGRPGSGEKAGPGASLVRGTSAPPARHARRGHARAAPVVSKAQVYSSAPAAPRPKPKPHPARKGKPHTGNQKHTPASESEEIPVTSSEAPPSPTTTESPPSANGETQPPSPSGTPPPPAPTSEAQPPSPPVNSP